MNRFAGRNQQTLTAFQRGFANEASGSVPPRRSKHDLCNQTQVRCTVIKRTCPQKAPEAKNFITIGNPMTMKVTGNMNTINGPINLTGASMACFSAR